MKSVTIWLLVISMCLSSNYVFSSTIEGMNKFEYDSQGIITSVYGNVKFHSVKETLKYTYHLKNNDFKIASNISISPEAMGTFKTICGLLDKLLSNPADPAANALLAYYIDKLMSEVNKEALKIIDSRLKKYLKKKGASNIYKKYLEKIEERIKD